MRPMFLVPSIVLALSCLGGPADASEPAPWSLESWLRGPSAWKGHAEGSSYVVETTTERPRMPNMPGVPKGGKSVTKSTHTLSKITPTEYVIKVETTSMGRTTSSETRHPRRRHSKATITQKGEGEVVVGSEAYACTILHISDYADLIAGSLPPPKSGEGRSMLPSGPADVWEHPKHGVLQVVASMSIMGRPNTMTMKVTNLSVSRNVGGHTFKCREVTLTNSMMPGKRVMHSARDFPGGTLWSHHEMSMMGTEQKTTEEVKAYVKKPLVVTEPPK